MTLNLTSYLENEIQRWNETIELLSAHCTYIVVDTENDVRTEKRIPGAEVGLGLSVSAYLPGTSHVISNYFPIRHIDVNIDQQTYQKLKKLLEDPSKIIICHNIKHDFVILEDLGIKTKDMKCYDTLLMELTLNGKQWSLELDYLSKKYGGKPKAMPPGMKELIEAPGMMPNGKTGLGWYLVPYKMMKTYAVNDTDITLELFHKHLKPKFSRFEKHHKTDIDFIRKCLIPMERIGVGINIKKCKEKYEYGINRMEEIQWREFNGLVPSSNNDLKTLLIDKLGLPILKRSEKTGKPSFDKKVMERYDNEYLSVIDSPVAKLILEYRGWQKATSSNYGPYINLVQRDGRLRCNFNMHRTVTTRLSSDTPNVQQIPRMSDKPWNGDLEAVFEPAPGYSQWKIDFSQLELRIIANDCRKYDPNFHLLQILNDPNGDIFTQMAKELGWKRQDVKTFVYMVSYGAGVGKIMGTFGIPRPQAQNMKDQFFGTYEPIDFLFKECMNTYKEKGRIKLWTGREIRNQIEDKPYAALDYRAQGGGAEIVKLKMNKIADTIDWRTCRLVLQIHDAIVPEIKIGYEDKWLPILKNIMEEPISDFFKVNFPVEIKQWGLAA